MVTYQLQQDIKVYRNQFERLCLEIFGDHRVERDSLDADALMFRVKYILKKQKDLDKIEGLKKEFSSLALKIRASFTQIGFTLVAKAIHNTDILKSVQTIFCQDVKMDASFVSFQLNIICDNEALLEEIQKIFDVEIYEIYPNEYFRFSTDSYNDGIAKAYPELFENRHDNSIGVGDDGDIFCHSITLQTTEDCNLCCSYCYQFNKSHMRMNFETGKRFIEGLLTDEYGYVNRHNSPAIILEFIGGEPFLEIDLTRKLYEYFLDRAYELDHPWFTLHRLSICSNGLLYFNEKVQEFFKEYSQMISFNISIDGNKELHDACRVQPNGEGSYDIAMAALDHYNKHHTPERNSKMTLAPANINHLFESVVDFINHDMKCINVNCVFEEGWTKETARMEFMQLCQLADYLISNHLENIYISVFRDRQEDHNDPSFDGTSCGGAGSMIAIRPNGDIYPCLRYMPTSVGDDVSDLSMGNVKTGMIGRKEGSDVLKLLDSITRRSQTNDICYNCPIANSCMNCQALGHTVYGTPNKRTTFICIQTIAEALANLYYWNRLCVTHPEYHLTPRMNHVPDEWALLIIDKNELEFLNALVFSAQTISSLDDEALESLRKVKEAMEDNE